MTAEPTRTPEEIAAIWQKLVEPIATIKDDETRAQYMIAARRDFERQYGEEAQLSGTVPATVTAFTWSDDGQYAWPDDADESERRLIMIVQRKLDLRRQRKEISDSLRDVDSMAKAIGFDSKVINACIRMIEQESAPREDFEAQLVLYRRVLGIKGPLDEAMLPKVIDARQKTVSTRARRAAKVDALIDMRAMATGEAA